MNDIYTFVLVALFLVISPGPNIVLILKTVSTSGRNAGLLNTSGFVLAAFIHGSLSILGLSAIIVQSAELFFLVKLIGAAYLFYLGVKTIYQSFAATFQKEGLATIKPKVKQSALQSFSEGFFNPNAQPKRLYVLPCGVSTVH